MYINVLYVYVAYSYRIVTDTCANDQFDFSEQILSIIIYKIYYNLLIVPIVWYIIIAMELKLQITISHITINAGRYINKNSR